jgi:hypothetical protein
MKRPSPPARASQSLPRSNGSWVRRGAWTALAFLAGACSVDLFHSTDWSTECNVGDETCHGNDHPDAGDGGLDGSDVTTAAACDELALSTCGAYARCSPLFFATSFAGDTMRCSDAISSACEKAYFGPGSSVSPQSLLACVAASDLAAASCAEVVRYFAGQVLAAECRVPGALRDGTPCVDARQCAGSVCAMALTDRCGVCATASPEGGMCAVASDCDLGLGCVAGFCRRLGEVGDGCMASPECYADLVCVGGACAARAEAREPCDASIQNCAVERYCNGQTMQCELITTSDEGASCGLTPEGGLASCTAFSTCQIIDRLSVTGNCVHVAEEGMPCAFDDGLFGPQCEFPARCVESLCYVKDASACR